MKQSMYKNRDELPMFLTVMDVAGLLGISRASAYELVREDNFPKLKIVQGRTIIPRDRLLEWLDEYMMFTLRESTIAGYRCMAEHQIKRFIGNKQLSSLTTADVQRFYNKVKKEGRAKPHPISGYELSNTMVRKVHMLLHQALDVAVKERLIVRNPTDGTTIPKKTTTEKQVLDDSQLERFMEAIKEEPYWNDFFYVEVMTGLRRGEICGIKWSDINFTEGTLSVKRSVSPQNLRC